MQELIILPSYPCSSSWEKDAHCYRRKNVSQGSEPFSQTEEELCSIYRCQCSVITDKITGYLERWGLVGQDWVFVDDHDCSTSCKLWIITFREHLLELSSAYPHRMLPSRHVNATNKINEWIYLPKAHTAKNA